MCGEQFGSSRSKIIFGGSPPRVRGTVKKKDAEKQAQRITPACAGNSRSRSGYYRLRRDHPRVCGEQFCVSFRSHADLGSPPRVRGTGPGWCKPSSRCRITPACAGNRALFGRVGKEDEDHPRVCGEQHTSSSVQSIMGGSPPRVRGTARHLNFPGF